MREGQLLVHLQLYQQLQQQQQQWREQQQQYNNHQQPAAQMDLGEFNPPGVQAPGPGPSPGPGHVNLSHDADADLGGGASTGQPDWAAQPAAANPDHTSFPPVPPGAPKEVLRHPTITGPPPNPAQPSINQQLVYSACHHRNAHRTAPHCLDPPAHRSPFFFISIFQFSIPSSSCASSQSPPLSPCAHSRQSPVQ